MLLKDAQAMARALMAQHGLTGWRFEFDRAVKRFGLCSYDRRTISLSNALTVANPEAEVRNVILHEIAHALVGPRKGHGPEWSRKAREIGCTAQRTHAATIPQLRWNQVCPNCHKVTQRARRSNSLHACGDCCRKYARGKFDARFTLEWRENPQYV